MLNLNYEFRRGIFFLRLIGELNEKTYLEQIPIIERLLTINGFKYIVINTNYLKKINLHGINCFFDLCNLSKKNSINLVICDKNNFFTNLLHNNIPNIKEELEVLQKERKWILQK